MSSLGSQTILVTGVAFLGSLPSLEMLSLAGPIQPPLYDCIVRQHGRHLRKLSLAPFKFRDWHPSAAVLGRGDVDRLGESCPMLEELHLVVKRSRGDKTEVGIYRSHSQDAAAHSSLSHPRLFEP